MHRIEDAIAAIKRGEMIVVSDDKDREDEGDLVMAAEMVTPEAINFMISEGRGLVCAPITRERADELGLREMAASEDRYKTAFTVSVDAKEGTTSGISASDRAKTIAKLVDPDSRNHDFYLPGHVFPLIAKKGGVLNRPGHTEAIIDLATLADLKPAGIICEIIKDNGEMARGKDLQAFVDKHKLVWITIAELIEWLKERDYEKQPEEVTVHNSGTVKIPSRHADEEFDLHCYLSSEDGKEHVAMVFGDVEDEEDVMVRVHSECLTGDVFHSARCDCGEQLELALQEIVKAGKGVLIYLRQEGRGIGLVNKIKAYSLQDQGMDTVDANVELGFPADMRDYRVAAHILNDLKVKSVRLLTNNPEKLKGLKDFGIEVHERLPLIIPAKEQNAFYLRTKKKRLGHML